MESQNMLNRANMFAYDDKIRLFDMDEETGLELFSYNTCSENDSDFVKNCRGLVFNDEKLISRSFPYTSEFSQNYDTVFENFSEWKFYTSYEGAILRLFYFCGKWFLSTHHKLNAFRSKWSSKESFGALFKRSLEKYLEYHPEFSRYLADGETILERFQNCLDKNYQYMFLLRNVQENRIVCNAPAENEPLVFHVGTFIENKLSMTENVGLPYPETLYFENLDDLKHWINDKVDPLTTQGVIAVKNNERYVKILHPEYHQYSKIRGNEPSVKFRYLQIRLDKTQTAKLFSLYPEMIREFDDYEESLFKISNNIYYAYVNRFIKKNYVTVPKEEYKIINECHKWHVEDRTNNRISLDRVIYMVNKQSATALNHMIRHYKLEQNKRDTRLLLGTNKIQPVILN